MFARNNPLFSVVFAGAVLLAASHIQGQICQPEWDHAVGNPGLNSTVWSLFTVEQASAVGPALYVGGQFSTAGGATAKNIVQWDGSAWSPLGTGAENGGVVYAMTHRGDGILYVGGAFGNMGGQPGTKRIAQWNGTSWSNVGGGMSQNNTGIRALQFFNGDLYAGGFLNEIGGISARKIAKWNGAAWSALSGDPLATTDSVLAFAVHDDGSGEALYVGGDFASAGGNANASYVFKWNGTTLEPVGRGVNDNVEAFAVFNGDLYVAGQFTEVVQPDGQILIAEKIARWDGTSWSALNSGMGTSFSTHVWALSVFDDGTGPALFVGGSFSTVDGQGIARIAKWDGSSWASLGDSTNLNGYVHALSSFSTGGQSGLYVGGTFSTNSGQSVQKIDEWRSGAPATPTNAMADADEICFGSSADLAASVPGAQIDWYTDGCGVGYLATGDAIVVSPPVTSTYYARAHVASNGCESAGCGVVTVSVITGPTLLSHPTGATVCTGQSHELCVSADGTEPLRYAWKRNGLNVLGATLPCYSATASGTYWCVVSNDCGTQVSNSAVVLVTDPPPGDVDGDCDVDLDDYVAFIACQSSPGVLPQPVPPLTIGQCLDVFDRDSDNDVDLTDFASFQAAFGE